MTLRGLAILAAFLLVTGGCGDDDDNDGSGSSGKGGDSSAHAGSGASGRGADAGAGKGGDGNAGASAGSGGKAGSAASGPTESGVAGGTRLDALTMSDKTKLCDWAADLPGLGVEKMCPDDSTVVAEVDTGQDCIDSLDEIKDCAATVAQYEACIEAQLDNPCEFFISECDPVFACLQ